MTDENAAPPSETPPPPHTPASRSSFGLLCVLGAGAGFLMAFADIGLPEAGDEFFRLNLSGFILFLSIALVSCVGLLLIFITPAAVSARLQPLNPHKFLMFAWLCVFFLNFNVEEVLRVATDELPSPVLLMETQERVLAVGMLLVGAIVITAYCLTVIRRGWEKLGKNLSLLWLTAHVWLVNFFGFLLASATCGPLDDKLNYVHVVAFGLSSAVAVVNWSALFLLAMAGMTRGIAQQRANGASPDREHGAQRLRDA